MRAVTYLALAALVSGCAAPRVVSQADSDDGMEPLVCAGADQCSQWWKRAQVWVATNSGFKIQTTSDAVIQTYNAPSYSMRWAFQITREPLGDGRERIGIVPSCGSAPICKERPIEVAAAFKRYVRRGASSGP